MNIKESLEQLKKQIVIEESLTDYAGPILIFGNINWLIENKNVITVSLTMSRDNFAIINNKYPNWSIEVQNKANEDENILIINDIDKVDINRQEILLDILEDNEISTEKLPDNLKIILHSNNKCDISLKIRDIVECYSLVD